MSYHITFFRNFQIMRKKTSGPKNFGVIGQKSLMANPNHLGIHQNDGIHSKQ